MESTVIYARYSSAGQTEQSIEGQLRVCKEHAERNGYFVIGEYIDLATTGTNGNRPELQRMLAEPLSPANSLDNANLKNGIRISV